MKIRYLVLFLAVLITLPGLTSYAPNNWAEEKVILNLIMGPNFIDVHADEEIMLNIPKSHMALKNKTAHIEIKDFRFIPNELNITSGTTVVWVNKDWTGVYGRRHLITAHYNKFRSPKLGYKEEFNFTFTEPGRYTYIDPLYKYSDNKTGSKITKAAINVN